MPRGRKKNDMEKLSDEAALNTHLMWIDEFEEAEAIDREQYLNSKVIPISRALRNEEGVNVTADEWIEVE